MEAAGVEPASENAVSKEPTYLVTFMRRVLPRHSRRPRSERTRNAACQPDDLAANSQVESLQPAHCATPLSRPMSKAEEDGNLIN